MIQSITFIFSKISDILNWLFHIQIPWGETSINFGSILIALFVIGVIVYSYRLMVFGSTEITNKKGKD